jgi:cyanate permease
MNRDKMSRVILRVFAFSAVFFGTLSLLGVGPTYSRAIGVVLGSASLLFGLALLVITNRSKSASRAAANE